MARLKRKSTEDDVPAVYIPSKRQKASVDTTAPSTRPKRASATEAPTPRLTRTSSNPSNKKGRPSKSSKANSAANDTSSKKILSNSKTTRSRKKPKETLADDEGEGQATEVNAKVSVDVPHAKPSASDPKTAYDRELETPDDGPSYWLMKAEPESRIEKGKDVKFSIDDLKSATEPEPWEGIRNFVARNNMRLMMKGDLAFFYHSNCKVPGIVGTMEVIREHSNDETAFDPEHPYFDEKSDREKPKWCLVHVEYRQKFPEIIKLKELQKYAKDGGSLEHMQTLKQSRLSVSKVTKKEWDFIMSLVEMEDVAAASAEHQPRMTK